MRAFLYCKYGCKRACSVILLDVHCMLRAVNIYGLVYDVPMMIIYYNEITCCANCFEKKSFPFSYVVIFFLPIFERINIHNDSKRYEKNLNKFETTQF